MTERITEVAEGPLGNEVPPITMIAGGDLTLWSPVKLAARGTGEDMARVVANAAVTDVIFGVVVGFDKPGAITAVAGDKVRVQTMGRCKLKVLATSVNIAVGDRLGPSATAGKAQKVTEPDHAVTYTAADANTQEALSRTAFCVALYESAADNDIIPVQLGAWG